MGTVYYSGDSEIFTKLFDYIDEQIEKKDFVALKSLIEDNFMPKHDRGVQRTILIALKPFRNHEMLAEGFKIMAESLRSTSTNKTI